MKTKLQLLVITFFFTTSIFSQTGMGCWRVVSAGTNFSLGIKMDGTLWGWGANGNLLGLNGVTPNQNLPIQIGSANDWATVSAGTLHSLAVKTNGTLWSWGNGQFGQLGNGIFNSASWTVTQIGTANDWLTVSAGNRFSLAIKNTGTLWSWGLNNFGQLGLNNLVNQNLPVQVGTANNWLKIDAGDQHSLAIDNTGFMYAWGNNIFGQFGNGTNTSSILPIIVSSSNNWVEVSAGFDHSMALDTNGIIYTFGNNTNGQLCDGTNIASNTMIPISYSNAGTVTQYIAISAGNNFSLAIKNDNTLYSGGLNTTGQLGLGNNIAVNTLNQVGTSATWYLISAGDSHSLAMETSTSLWSTGRNLEGALGIGNFAFSYNVLQNIACPNTALALTEFDPDTTKLTLYPNPTKDIVNIVFKSKYSEIILIQLTNIQGQLIEELKIEGDNGLFSVSIDLNNQSSGMYFIKVNSELGNFTEKIIKN